MTPTYLPDNFNPPEEVALGKYLLRKFREEDNSKDYAAVMANAELIDKVRGGKLCHDGWPSPDFTLEANLKDVQSFIRRFEDKSSVSYALWDETGEKYIGSVYFFPIQKKYPELADKYDVDFSMWVIQEVYDISGEFAQVYGLVWEWLCNEWPFDPKRIYHRNNEIPIQL